MCLGHPPVPLSHTGVHDAEFVALAWHCFTVPAQRVVVRVSLHVWGGAGRDCTYREKNLPVITRDTEQSSLDIRCRSFTVLAQKQTASEMPPDDKAITDFGNLHTFPASPHVTLLLFWGRSAPLYSPRKITQKPGKFLCSSYSSFFTPFSGDEGGRPQLTGVNLPPPEEPPRRHRAAPGGRRAPRVPRALVFFSLKCCVHKRLASAFQLGNQDLFTFALSPVRTHL